MSTHKRNIFIATLTMLAVAAATAFAMNVGNMTCPVSGEPVDEMGKPYQMEHDGKVYNLCCKMCAKDFNKNPEKFSKIAEETAALKQG